VSRDPLAVSGKVHRGFDLVAAISNLDREQRARDMRRDEIVRGDVRHHDAIMPSLPSCHHTLPCVVASEEESEIRLSRLLA